MVLPLTLPSLRRATSCNTHRSVGRRAVNVNLEETHLILSRQAVFYLRELILSAEFLSPSFGETLERDQVHSVVSWVAVVGKEPQEETTAERRRAEARRSFREAQLRRANCSLSLPMQTHKELWHLPSNAPKALKALRGTYYLNGDTACAFLLIPRWGTDGDVKEIPVDRLWDPESDSAEMETVDQCELPSNHVGVAFDRYRFGGEMGFDDFDPIGCHSHSSLPRPPRLHRFELDLNEGKMLERRQVPLEDLSFEPAGTESAINKLKDAATKAGAIQARLLKTSGGFHTDLMKLLPKMQPPKCDVYSNFTGKKVKDGLTEFYEVGPMKQLKALVDRIGGLA
eukprot:Skav219296  [mRNA]  locus=scaffold2157:453498:464173:+ [translate_table: standard]